MKRVLVISYLFPPLHCGVGRQIKVVKYLRSFGWLPIVLTVKRSFLRPSKDPTRLKEIPEFVEVHRTFSIEISLLQQYLPRFLDRHLGINRKWFQIPDNLLGWFPFAVREGLKIIRQKKVDAIFSTSLPETSHLVALMLKRLSAIPWVADFRDPWTQNPYVDYPEPVLRVESRMEGAVVRNADKITTTMNLTAKGFAEKYRDQPNGKFVAISHGFDPEDFDVLQVQKTERLTLTYIGALYGLRRADIFLEAVNELLRDEPNLKGELKLRFIAGGRYVERLVKALDLEDSVQILGYMPHHQALKYLYSSDVLLLITGVSGERVRRRSYEKVVDEMPGKLVEYIALGKPILALAMKGRSTARVIESTKTGVVVDVPDKEAIKEAIRGFYEKYKRGTLKIEPNTREIEKYNVLRSVKKLAQVLNEVTRA